MYIFMYMYDWGIGTICREGQSIMKSPCNPGIQLSAHALESTWTWGRHICSRIFVLDRRFACKRVDYMVNIGRMGELLTFIVFLWCVLQDGVEEFTWKCFYHSPSPCPNGLCQKIGGFSEGFSSLRPRGQCNSCSNGIKQVSLDR